MCGDSVPPAPLAAEVFDRSHTNIVKISMSG